MKYAGDTDQPLSNISAPLDRSCLIQRTLEKSLAPTAPPSRFLISKATDMRHTLPFIFIDALVVCAFAGVAMARDIVVESPDERTRLTLSVSEAANGVRFSVERDGKLLLEPSPIAIRLATAGSLDAGARVESVSEAVIDEASELLWGKTRRLRDHCHATSVRLKSPGGSAWDIVLRAYDDGVALRYGCPKQENFSRVVVEGEATEFRLAGNPTMLFMTLDHFTTSHEAVYERKQLSELPQQRLLAVPLLAVWKDGPAAAITEARLRNFGGMYLECEVPSPQRSPAQRGNILRNRLSPLPANMNSVAEVTTPFWSPWRVVLLADHAGELLESTLLQCLNDQPEGDFGWAEPGKTTWPWWNGEVEHGPPSSPEVNFTTYKRYIDFCATHKIKYHAICSVAGNYPWYVQAESGFGRAWPDSDVTTPRPDLDLPRILDYAMSKGVGIRLWVHWKALDAKLDEAFAAYERWGIKGLMVDFMDRDDQEMVEWQERCLRTAAKHKLHIQFHGSSKPTGEERTFPNLFNREGVLNLEYLKWSDLCAPPHHVNVAYTRALAGPTDFHLGGFRAAARDKFQPRDLMPLVMGTRAHQLALYVVYENPMPMVADAPEAYEDQPGFEFVVDVPTTWDETKFVAGEAGEYLVLARRSGDKWYLGGITNWTPHELNLPLEFLGDGQFEATVYSDTSRDGTKPNDLRKDRRTVTADKPLEVALASGGGFVAVFRPKANSDTRHPDS
jgi:alpha-glucosidase